MSQSSVRTVRDMVAELRRGEQSRSAATAKSIKELWAAGGSPDEAWQRPTGMICRAPEKIRKLSPNGRHLGWYRVGQRVGKPNPKLPVHQDNDRALDEWARAMCAAVVPQEHTAVMGLRSGKARAACGLRRQIEARMRVLDARGESRRHRAKLVARELNCNVEYVRRVARRMAAATGSRSAGQITT